MQIFGLLSLLTTIAVVGWWLSVGMGSAPTAPTEDGTNAPTQQQSYQGAIESAESVVNQIEVRNNSVTQNPPASGPKIEVYQGISVAKNSTVLDVSGKKLTGSLKAEVRQLENLEELNISNNNFTGLPAEVGQLSKLKVLNLSYNPLTGLPYELGNLSNLQVLDLRGTNYASADLQVIKSKLPASTQILVD